MPSWLYAKTTRPEQSNPPGLAPPQTYGVPRYCMAIATTSLPWLDVGTTAASGVEATTPTLSELVELELAESELVESELPESEVENGAIASLGAEARWWAASCAASMRARASASSRRCRAASSAFSR